jgi:DNA-binding NarL/FixJ family response regulator
MEQIGDMTVKHIEFVRKAKDLNARLSTCEQRIVLWATKGFTNKQIASHIGSSPKTIARHIESITRKAEGVYQQRVSFRSFIVPQLYCFYFAYDLDQLVKI